MSEFDPSGFLAEVIADPDSDSPRLVYADWLEEQGDPRAEFIRVQCAIEQIDDLDPQYLDLWYRISELLELHGETWANELQQDVRKTTYRRGFIDTVTVRAKAFLNQGEQLFQKLPVRWLRLNYLKGSGDKWNNCSALRFVSFLDLQELKIPDADLVGLLGSPHLTNLRGIKLGGYDHELSRIAADAFSHAQVAEQLEELEFTGTLAAMTELFDSLGRSIGLPSLKRLKLRSLTYGGPMLPAEIRDMPFGSLERLEVAGELTTRDASQLAKLPLSDLKELKVSSIPGAGVEAISDAGALHAVKTVEFPHGQMPLRATEFLFRGQQLRHCEELNLLAFGDFSSRSQCDQFIERLTSHQPLTSLRRLHLAGLEPGHLTQLAQCSYLQNLQSLVLHQSTVTAEDFDALLHSEMAKSLRRLTLAQMCPPPDAFAVLARGVFPQLLDFSIDCQYTYRVSVEGIEPHLIGLLESPAFPVLQSLGLTGLGLTKATGYSVALFSSLPELRQFFFDDNKAENELIGTVLTSVRLPKLHLFSLKECKGLRRSKKLAERYGRRLQY